MGLGLDRSEFRLRALATADGEMVRGWRNQDHIRKNMYTDHIITPDEHARWLSKVLTDPSSDYAVFEHKRRPIGLVGFYNIAAEHERADWAFYLGVRDAIKGSGPAMEFFALDYAFSTLGICKLCCEVFTFNKAVIKLHRRFGFVEEGLRKAHFIRNGRGEDVVELAIFKDHWLSKRRDLQNGLFCPEQCS